MVLFIDCQVAGISGDMILSSLVDLGANKSKIIDGVKKSANLLDGTTIKKLDFIKVQKNGKSATQLILEIDENTHERKGSEMKKCIESSSNMLELSTFAKEFAVKSINTLITAESNVHGETESSVHFHEASSVDTIVDIIGTAIALDDLNLFNEEISCSPVAIGGGTVSFSHGTTSNPAYAITEIFKNSKIILKGGPVNEELTTPTGASILVNLVSSCKEFFVDMSIDSVGYGSGTKDFDGFANVLKLIRGKSNEILIKDSVQILETNLDDVSGEVIANTIEKLMENGAKDVTVSNAITKKGRPSQLVSVICDPKNTNSLLKILISETRTLGVRIRNSQRYVVPRKILESIVTLENQNFTIHYKITNSEHFKLEYEDVKMISNQLSLSFNKTEELLREQIKKIK
ncbi:MAG: nickel pincer cofactor biosynthesis protein LarC [Crenarchaeota archaeon]|nr:nickel pincer cofactor biosynthesis protein LarC [Thermoproteota archaeon]MDA1124958.1 nickel pincer cofactor biosynthesis protein LarC [Thermoproteota archaeon]